MRASQSQSPRVSIYNPPSPGEQTAVAETPPKKIEMDGKDVVGNLKKAHAGRFDRQFPPVPSLSAGSSPALLDHAHKPLTLPVLPGVEDEAEKPQGEVAVQNGNAAVQPSAPEKEVKAAKKKKVQVKQKKNLRAKKPAKNEVPWKAARPQPAAVSLHKKLLQGDALHNAADELALRDSDVFYARKHVLEPKWEFFVLCHEIATQIAIYKDGGTISEGLLRKLTRAVQLANDVGIPQLVQKKMTDLKVKMKACNSLIGLVVKEFAPEPLGSEAEEALRKRAVQLAKRPDANIPPSENLTKLTSELEQCNMLILTVFKEFSLQERMAPLDDDAKLTLVTETHPEVRNAREGTLRDRIRDSAPLRNSMTTSLRESLMLHARVSATHPEWKFFFLCWDIQQQIEADEGKVTDSTRKMLAQANEFGQGGDVNLEADKKRLKAMASKLSKDETIKKELKYFVDKFAGLLVDDWGRYLDACE
jgi:hypothetical protein